MFDSITFRPQKNINFDFINNEIAEKVTFPFELWLIRLTVLRIESQHRIYEELNLD